MIQYVRDFRITAFIFMFLSEWCLRLLECMCIYFYLSVSRARLYCLLPVRFLCHKMSQNVTKCHKMSQWLCRYLVVFVRTVFNRAEESYNYCGVGDFNCEVKRKILNDKWNIYFGYDISIIFSLKLLICFFMENMKLHNKNKTSFSGQTTCCHRKWDFALLIKNTRLFILFDWFSLINESTFLSVCSIGMFLWKTYRKTSVRLQINNGWRTSSFVWECTKWIGEWS